MKGKEVLVHKAYDRYTISVRLTCGVVVSTVSANSSPSLSYVQKWSLPAGASRRERQHIRQLMMHQKTFIFVWQVRLTRTGNKGACALRVHVTR